MTALQPPYHPLANRNARSMGWHHGRLRPAQKVLQASSSPRKQSQPLQEVRGDYSRQLASCTTPSIVNLLWEVVCRRGWLHVSWLHDTHRYESSISIYSSGLCRTNSLSRLHLLRALPRTGSFKIIRSFCSFRVRGSASASGQLAPRCTFVSDHHMYDGNLTSGMA